MSYETHDKCHFPQNRIGIKIVSYRTGGMQNGKALEFVCGGRP